MLWNTNITLLWAVSRRKSSSQELENREKTPDRNESHHCVSPQCHFSVCVTVWMDVFPVGVCFLLRLRNTGNKFCQLSLREEGSGLEERNRLWGTERWHERAGFVLMCSLFSAKPTRWASTAGEGVFTSAWGRVFIVVRAVISLLFWFGEDNFLQIFYKRLFDASLHTLCGNTSEKTSSQKLSP